MPQKSGLVAIALKRAYADGTVAVEMDPLSPPRHHTVKYAGLLAAASKLRARIGPSAAPATEAAEPKPTERRSSYWPWALLMRRTFVLDVLECPKCKGRMKLMALVTDDGSVARYLKRDRRADAVNRRSELERCTTVNAPL